MMNMKLLDVVTPPSVYQCVNCIEDRSKHYNINIRYTSVIKFFIMTFDYSLCRVLVKNLKSCLFCWYISVSPAQTHSSDYSDIVAGVFIYRAPLDNTHFLSPEHGHH